MKTQQPKTDTLPSTTFSCNTYNSVDTFALSETAMATEHLNSLFFFRVNRDKKECTGPINFRWAVYREDC